MAEALCSVFKQPAMIAASAPTDRIDIAFIICFLVHEEARVYRVTLSEANRNQDPASCQESYPRIKLIGGKPMDHNASMGIAAGNVIERQEQGGEFKEV